MDKLPPFGRTVDDVLLPTFAVYTPLLIAREREIRSTAVSTHQYGPTARHQVDVYLPAAAAAPSSGPVPVLIFVYGGGFVSGARVHEGFAHSLVFGNVGHFFAARGVAVLVPDYRLLAHGARFPSGGEDVALAVAWAAAHLPALLRRPDLDLFLLGNSAGGIHAATYLLAPEFRASRAAVTGPGAGPRLRGVALLGVPFHWGGEDNAVLRAYLGAEPDAIRERSPLGLLRAARARGSPEEGRPPLPGVAVALLVSELDPDLIRDSTDEFARAWEDAGGAAVRHLLDGHNHISPQLGLGTGIEREEAWGVQLLEFLRANARKPGEEA
ncbi:alpha/beta-hydrolase [Durotheca rogersii]|uniref:alpha/beta-hydrolase n=1 Tax=Durotheca rogersii TaxID=419775 RepID=UPI00221FC24D|nr:alpha/beta-hydrolase [Durotheca rogersii]KAI5864108.1 alpha/beta-hydrolase [Durotheca rogersii]